MDEGRKKQTPLRLSESLWREIAAWAEDEFRSVNGQIEYILTEAVRRRKAGRRSGREGEGIAPEGGEVPDGQEP